MGAVVALIALLMTLLSGLAVGLSQDGVSGLQQVPATSFAFEQGVSTDSAFSRSVVGPSQVQAWQSQPAVRAAAPFGNTLANARTNRGVEIDLALFGVQVGSFMDPEVADGRRLGTGSDIVVSKTAADAGVAVGDTVTLEPSGNRADRHRRPRGPALHLRARRRRLRAAAHLAESPRPASAPATSSRSTSTRVRRRRGRARSEPGPDGRRHCCGDDVAHTRAVLRGLSGLHR